MTDNSSSFLNLTLVPPPKSFASSFYNECLKFKTSFILYSTYTVTSVIVILPLCILVLCIGLRGRNRQPVSHSDCFTYHCVAMEIVTVLGSVIYYTGIYTDAALNLLVGIFLFSITFPAQTLFHLLTCVERYLAVVQPITYMRLRDRSGVKIRNFSIGCVWLTCLGWVGLTEWYMPEIPVNPLISMLGISILVIFFCCLSVLCVLIRSGPGKVGRKMEQVDQSKRKAFHIICAIICVLLLRFVGLLISLSLVYVESIRFEDLCMILDLGIFLTLPSSLVLPLLYLQKTRLLAFGRRNQ